MYLSKWRKQKPATNERDWNMGWTYSILNWYDNRERSIDLPETLKQIETETKILNSENESEKEHETVQYWRD